MVTPGSSSWDEYRRLVLAELERLNKSGEDLLREMGRAREDFRRELEAARREFALELEKIRHDDIRPLRSFMDGIKGQTMLLGALSGIVAGAVVTAVVAAIFRGI